MKVVLITFAILLLLLTLLATLGGSIKTDYFTNTTWPPTTQTYKKPQQLPSGDVQHFTNIQKNNVQTPVSPAGTPVSTAGTPVSPAGTPVSTAGTPGPVLNTAETSKSSVQIPSMINPTVQTPNVPITTAAIQMPVSQEHHHMPHNHESFIQPFDSDNSFAKF